MLCLAVGCSEKPVGPDSGHDLPEGKVMVKFRLQGMMSPISDFGDTKSKAGDAAVPETKAAANDLLPTLRDLKHPTGPMPIPDGSTVWISYVKKTGDGQYEDVPHYYPCLVGADAGFNSLYPLNVKDTLIEGEVYRTPDRGSTGTSLILDKNTEYRFKMMYPALPIRKSDNKIKLTNGMFFCTHDGRYEQTAPVDVLVTDVNAGIAYVTLNPIVHQTSRFGFVIRAGENVTALDLMHTGIEVSGIQTPGVVYKENGDVDPDLSTVYSYYEWPSMEIADTIVMKRGDKFSWTTIDGEDAVKSTYVADSATGLRKDMISAEICFLPTNAQSSSVIILFSMLLNGIPTQYVVTVSQSETFNNIFEHAHSYNFDMTVNRKNGITVITWQNQSWVADMVMKPV